MTGLPSPALPTRNIVADVSRGNQQMIRWFEDVTSVARTGVPDGDKGDISVSGSGTVWAINAGVVTLAKMADLPAETVIGSVPGGVPVALSDSDLIGILGLAAIATSGSADDLTGGTLPAARFDDTSHGNRGGGSLHSLAVASGDAGFMSGADKAKLDGVDPFDETWVYLVNSWSVAPSIVGASTVSGQPGDVYDYTLGGVTRYRFVPTTYDPTLDGFYSTFTAGTLSGLIATRG